MVNVRKKQINERLFFIKTIIYKKGGQIEIKKTAYFHKRLNFLLKTYYFFEQQDFLAEVEQDFASFLSVQAFSVLAFAFSFSFSLKVTTDAEETINAITATIDNTFFMLFIFKLLFYTYL